MSIPPALPTQVQIRHVRVIHSINQRCFLDIFPAPTLALVLLAAPAAPAPAAAAPAPAPAALLPESDRGCACLS